MQKNNPKIMNAWAMYDWANSVYSLVITSTIFPLYWEAVSANVIPHDKLTLFFGIRLESAALYSYATSISFLIVVLINPFLTAIADYSGKKRLFMRLFAWMGATACLGLFWFDVNSIELGIILYSIASIGFSGSIVFYNAFLSDIATPDQHDRLSAKGFMLGYVGSVLLLVVNLALLMSGIMETGLASRISFLTVGFWWFFFSLLSIRKLPTNVYNRKDEGNYLLNGFKELKKVWAEAKNLPVLKRYLLAFFLYNTGVQTVMYLAALFGSEELEMDSSQLIPTILILQLVAIGGAFIFSRLSAKMGNVAVLLLMVTLWVVVCIAAYLVQTPLQFYGVAALVGLVMGGVQSLSRSTYSKLIPENTVDTASYFSFYEMLDKGGTALGTFIYAGVIQLTGNMRASSLVLMVFFIAGGVLLYFIKSKKLMPEHSSVNET